MCGRYRRTTGEEELARRYHIPIPPQRDLPISWNIAPTQDVLAIRLNPETKQRSLGGVQKTLIDKSLDRFSFLTYFQVNFRVGKALSFSVHIGLICRANIPSLHHVSTSAVV
jgi:putative SOS response-associated peptidase YedK